MAIVLDEPTFGEIVLNYTLFAGAIFQLICIFAVIALPSSAEEKVDEALQTPPASGTQSTPKSAHDYSSRRSKKEKKKHK